MDGKSILLIGATGLVGNEILKLLINDSRYRELVVLTRRKLYDYDTEPKIKQILVDFERLTDYSEFIRADHVISTLGTTIKKAGTKENFRRVDLTYTVKVAEIAKTNGAEHFILVSSLGANPDSRIFYNRVKGEVEKAITDLGFRSVSIFRPSFLLGKRNEFRIGDVFGKTVMKMFSFVLPKKYEPTEAYQLAEAILHIAHKNEPGIKIYENDQIQDLYYEQL